MSQQYISTQLLLFKYRKLFYLLSLNNDKIIKTVRDMLLMFDNFNYFEKATQFEQGLYFFQQVGDNNGVSFPIVPIRVELYNDQINVSDDYFYGLLQKDSVVISYQEKIDAKSIVKLLTQQDVETITFKDIFIYRESKYTTDGVLNSQANNLSLQQKFVKQIYSFDQSYKNYQNSYIDYNNYIQIINNNYVFELYLGDKLLGVLNDFLFYNIVDKKVLKDQIGNKELVLKIFDYNHFLLKSIVLKKSVQFNLLVKKNRQYATIVGSQIKNGISLYSNKLNLKGFNIYHSNEICQIYYSDFINRNQIFSNYIANQIVSSINIQKEKYLILFQNSSVVLRFNFNKCVYVKKILLRSNLTNKKYNLSVRYGFLGQLKQKQFCSVYKDKQQNLVLEQNGSLYAGGFYCDCLDLRIDYFGQQNLQIDKIVFFVYVIDFTENRYSDYIQLNKLNNIILSVYNTICNVDFPQSCFSKYFFQNLGERYYYLIPKNNNNAERSNIGVLLQNMNDNQEILKCGFFSTLDMFVESSFEFTLSYNALSKSLVNPFGWIHVQYEIQKKDDSSLFNLMFFRVCGHKYNFPRVVCLTYGTYTGVFVHTNVQSDYINNQYAQKWLFSYVLQKDNGDSYFKQGDYVSFVYRQQGGTVDGVNTYEWSLYAKIVLNGQIVNNNSSTGYVQYFTQDEIELIAETPSNGFKIGNSFQFFAKEKKFAGYKIFTKQVEANDYVLIYNSVDNQYTESNRYFYSYSSFDFTKNRDFKIVFWDGDDEKFKLYSVHLQNYDYNDGIVFLQQNVQQLSFNSQNSINKNIILQDDFYNVLYSINYIEDAPTSGVIIQGERTTFNEQSFVLVTKNNVHFEWEDKCLFQYLILFDVFTKESYQRLFLPFSVHYTTVNCYLTSQSYRSNKIIKEFEYFSDEEKIFVNININEHKSISNNIKFDYFIKYSTDGLFWCRQFYYRPFRLFKAKFVKVICIINFEYFDGNIDVTFGVVNANNYYLTNNNQFDSFMLRQLHPNNNYIFRLYKYYNGQFLPSKIKLLKADDVIESPLNPMTIFVDLYKKNNDYEVAVQQNSIRKISGIDRKIQIFINIDGFSNVQSYRFVVFIYVSVQNCWIQIDSVQKLYEDMQVKDRYLFFEYSFNENYFSFDNIYSVNLIYFNQSNCASGYSEHFSFKFNNIPAIPLNLNILQNEEIKDKEQ